MVQLVDIQQDSAAGPEPYRFRTLCAPTATAPIPGVSPVAGKPIIARFDGGSLSSDGALLALREVEVRLGVAERLAECIDDPRARHSTWRVAQFDTLRLRPVKLATRAVALKTRVMLRLPTACSDKAIQRLALERLPRLTC